MEQGVDSPLATAVEQPLAGPWRDDGRVRRQLIADAGLLLVTVVWGATFVMVKDAVSAFPVFSFLALRFALAALALAPFAIRYSLRAAKSPSPAGRRNTAGLVRASVLVGLALFAGYALQTAGLILTTPAKAGFITGLSVVIVPLGAAVLLRQPPTRNAWLGVLFATGGLALLSVTRSWKMEAGDLLVLGCAFSFAAHILLLGRFAPHYHPLLLTMGQVTVVALLSAAAAHLFDEPAPISRAVLGAAAFTGVLATALAFGIQTVAQRFTTSTHTALIFAAEPVFAGLASYLLIGELLGPRQIAGSALIVLGMVVAELKMGARR